MRISDWSSDVCSSDLWSYNPSAWTQRLPIIFLALIGLLVARYLTAYQLGQISGVWEPFFPGLPDEPGKNGTEAVITSSVSEAFPIPDAAHGGNKIGKANV